MFSEKSLLKSTTGIALNNVFTKTIHIQRDRDRRFSRSLMFPSFGVRSDDSSHNFSSST